jgi:hypothetical protein
MKSEDGMISPSREMGSTELQKQHKGLALNLLWKRPLTGYRLGIETTKGIKVGKEGRPTSPHP